MSRPPPPLLQALLVAAAAVAVFLPVLGADLLHFDDDWLVTISGEGSFFIRADSNLWPFLKETLIPVWYLDRPWQGPRNYRPTAGPGEGGSAIVAGATGRFANLEGTAVESYELSGFDKIRGPGDLTARLFVSLPGKATSLAAE